MKKLLIMTGLSAITAMNILAANCNVTLTTSAYVNWNAINASDKAGLYDQIEKKHGCNLKIVYYPDYLQSLDYFKTGKADAVTVTNLDQMTAIGAKPSTAVVLQDYSNGNDGLISRKKETIAQLKGQDIWMVTKSISEQLWVEAVTKAGLDPYKDFKVKHMDLDSNLRSAYDAGKIDNIVTWNPALEYLVQKTDSKKTVVSSADFPGIIVDMIVLQKDTENFDKKADFLRACWDKTAAVIHTQKGEEYNKFMIEIADDMGSSIGEAKAMLSGAKIFTPQEEITFFKDKLPKLQTRTYTLAEKNEFLMEPVSYELHNKSEGSASVKPTVYFSIK